MSFDWKKESEMFNQMADYYDKYRPSYPSEIIDTIIAKSNLTSGSKILEIGAGSGKATEQFADFGFEMVCIEHGEDLVKRGNEKLEGKNIKFIASKFEDYDAPNKYFDAIISAQAFHWLDQPIGYEKCANALKDDGYLAPFWNVGLADSNDELFDIVYKYGPVSCMPRDKYEKRMETIASGIAESGRFRTPEIIHCHWEKSYSVDEYCGYLLTGNVFLQKPDEEKQQCYEGIKMLAAKNGGIIRCSYVCELYLARKM